MSEKTKNLGLFKYIPETDGKQVFSIVEALNNNWDILDVKGAGSGFNLFDTKLVDHVLEEKEAEGWALQGTYVYKEAVAGSRYGYPDFYNKCVEEKDLGTATETVLGGNTITLYTNANGHTFYDIADKEAIDAWYNTCGIAWYYGIDTDNERIFLPRTKWFLQPSGEITEVNTVNEAGLPNITGRLISFENAFSNPSGAFSISGKNGAANYHNAGSTNMIRNIDFNASTSNNLYGKSTTVQPPSINQLLYMCVGNTICDTSWVDVVTQVEGGVKDLEDKTNEGLEALSNASNALRQTQITNCILEIPQRIKYTLQDGTLTIKAGSVVIVPYGTEDLTSQYPVGSTFINDNFKVYDMQYADGKFFVWAELQIDKDMYIPSTSRTGAFADIVFSSGIIFPAISHVSGTTAPTAGRFYNTETNIYYDLADDINALGNAYHSFPLLICDFDVDKGYTNVSQVFNGMGYIGSTVWIDKDVKCLIPNGKNADGTLNNEIREVSELYTYNIPENMIASRQYINLYGQQQSLKLATYGTSQVFMQESAPVCTNTHVLWLDTCANKFKYTENSGVTWTAVNLCNIGIWNPLNSIGKLIHLQSNVLLSRGQSPEISSWGMPSSKYIDLTLGNNGTTYTAPANGWFTVRGFATNNYCQLWINNIDSLNAVGTRIYIPAKDVYGQVSVPITKGNRVVVSFTNFTCNMFRFVYAEGEI